MAKEPKKSETDDSKSNTNTTATKQTFSIPEKVKEAKYVKIPCDTNDAIEELSIKLPDSTEEELTVFIDKLKDHYRKCKKSSKTTENQISNIKKQLSENKSADMSKIDPKWIEQAASFEMVTALPLLPSIPTSGNQRQPIGSPGYMTVQMYCDDNGMYGIDTVLIIYNGSIFL